MEAKAAAAAFETGRRPLQIAALLWKLLMQLANNNNNNNDDDYDYDYDDHDHDHDSDLIIVR